MEALSDELLFWTLEWVPPIDLLRSTTLVSKRYAALIQSEKFWRCHPLSPTGSLTKHQLQRCCLYMASVSSEVPIFLQPGSVLLSREEANIIRDDLGKRTCAASTTDFLQESLENVLSDGNQDDGTVPLPLNRLRWWSSKPSPTKESNEVLLFTTRYPVALISEVKIKPLLDPAHHLVRRHLREGEGDFYTWKKTVFRAFRLPLESLLDADAPQSLAGFPCMFQTAGLREEPRVPPQQRGRFLMDDGPSASPDQDTIDHLLSGHQPVYESQELGVPVDSDEMISFVFPPGVVANVVTITLYGKNREQRAGMGYYSCVEKVDCLGIPLYEYPAHANVVEEARVSLQEYASDESAVEL
jgi:hypothetical protein